MDLIVVRFVVVKHIIEQTSQLRSINMTVPKQGVEKARVAVIQQIVPMKIYLQGGNSDTPNTCWSIGVTLFPSWYNPNRNYLI